MTTTAHADATAVVPADAERRAPRGQHVYVTGVLGFDFGTEERQEAILAANGGAPIVTLAEAIRYLRASPLNDADFDSLIWTLSQDCVPMYAIRPQRPVAALDFRAAVLGPEPDAPRRRQPEGTLSDPEVERLAVPGRLTGEVTLLDGRVVPVIDPDLQGIRRFSSEDVARALAVSGIAASTTLAPPSVDLNKAPPNETLLDWISWAQPTPARRTPQPAARLITTWTDSPPPIPEDPVDPGQVGHYSQSTIAISAGGAPQTTGAGVAPIVGSGLSFAVVADATPRILRIYARTFSSVGQLTATLRDTDVPAYVSTSFSEFPSIAGLPGVVDGVYKIVYAARRPTQLVIQLNGTPIALCSPSPLTVTLSPGGHTLGVGRWTAAALAARGITSVTSVTVPAGLCLTLFAGDDFMIPGSVVASGQLKTAFDATKGSLIVEPETYVGLQAAQLTRPNQAQPAPGQKPGPKPPIVPTDEGPRSFMNRLYYLLQNAGRTPPERAINFAAAQAAQSQVLVTALGAGLALETVTATVAPFCRRGADCWDVRLVFFDPAQVMQAPRTVARLTVDVANLKPAALSEWRVWTRYD